MDSFPVVLLARLDDGNADDLAALFTGGDAAAGRAVAREVETVTSVADAAATVRAGAETDDPAVDVVVAVTEEPATVRDLLEGVRGHDPGLPVVVYAAGLSADAVRGLFGAGVTDYVPSEVPAATVVLAERVRLLGDERRAYRLREGARERIPTVLDTVSEAVFAVTHEWRVVYCNRAAEAVVGEPAETALGRLLFDDLDRLADTAFEPELRRAMERDETVAFEATLDGSRYDVRAHPSAGGVTVFARDVTPRYERDRLFRGVFEGAMDAMVIADDEGRYVDVNRSAVGLFGAGDEADLLGRSIGEFAPEGYDVDAAWEAFLASDEERGVFPLVSLDGEQRVVEFAATPNVVEGRHLSVLRDVTGRPGYPSFDALVERSP